MMRRALARASIFAALAGPGAALAFACVQVAPDQGAQRDAGIDAAPDPSADAGARAASTCGPRPVPSDKPSIPDAGRRGACPHVQFVNAVTGCAFIELSPTLSAETCRKTAQETAADWQPCTACIFGEPVRSADASAEADADGAAPVEPDASPETPTTPLILDDGLATVNVAACLALVANERHVEAADRACVREYTFNQWCERKACAQCAAEAGARAYDECRTLVDDGGCPVVSAACGLEASDAGCDVLPDFLQTVRNYAYRFCLAEDGG